MAKGLHPASAFALGALPPASRAFPVNNGDIGVVQAIDRELKILAVSFDGRRVEYPFRELSSLSLAYCTTVHKSQGSEYPVVVVVVDMMCSALLNRKLLYTAVTRAKSRVVLVGQARAVHIAVSEARAHVRHTQLGARLRALNAESKAPQPASA